MTSFRCSGNCRRVNISRNKRESLYFPSWDGSSQLRRWFFPLSPLQELTFCVYVYPCFSYICQLPLHLLASSFWSIYSTHCYTLLQFCSLAAASILLYSILFIFLLISLLSALLTISLFRKKGCHFYVLRTEHVSTNNFCSAVSVSGDR